MTGEQVTTVQELEALSSATVIRDGNGVIYERVYDEEWSSPGDACVWDDEIVALPAVVLYRPDRPERCVCGSPWPHALPEGVGPWHGPDRPVGPDECRICAGVEGVHPSPNDEYARGWEAAMRFAHHAHTDENGRTSANGVLGSGPDCVIVDEDWLNEALGEAERVTVAVLQDCEWFERQDTYGGSLRTASERLRETLGNLDALPARPSGVSTEQVEAVARAIFEESQELDQDNEWDDPTMPDEWRDGWRSIALAALAALGSPVEDGGK